MPDAQTVTSVKHWTDRLFSFRVTRPKSLRFRSGEFVMIGLLKDDGKPLLRAYSIASPSWDDELEFYSIKVQDGPLTSRLQHLKVNDQIILRPKPVGTLVHDALLPGRRLWLFATGTGIAPFASLIRDPQTFEDYDQVILTHTCRELAELEYGRLLVEGLSKDELMIELLGKNNIKKLNYYPTTTRENSSCMGRITEKLKNNKEDINKLVNRLLATQLENGYMGTYAEENRFMKMLENKSMSMEGSDMGSLKFGWDVWTHRYNLYGLLTYEKYYPSKKVIDACRKMGDLLIEVFGEGKADITKYGTRQGISSMTILESIVMLYERTLDKKYLDFAEHLVKISEQNNKLRLMGNMLEKGSVVNSGDGKAYQLMANLLGYLRLYRCTGCLLYTSDAADE